MIRKRGLVLVLLSLLMGGSAAWVAKNWVEARSKTAAAETDTATVVAAAINIPYGTKVQARHLKVMNLPRNSVPSGAVRNREDVEGFVSTSEILAGEILFSSRFVEHDSGSTLAALVAPNKRAVTVRVDDVIGVAGFLLPGNFVDVVATRVERRTKRAKSETILQNLKVLAVDQTAKTSENEPVVVRAVTLEMSPAQAEVLVKRKEEGTIQLTLRNPLDVLVAEEKPEVKPAPKPRARPAPRRRSTTTKIEIIRGTQVETQKAKS